MVSRATCNGCNQTLLFVRDEEGNLVLIVFCQHCKVQVEVNLDDMSSLAKGEDMYDRMLRNFKPKGGIQ